MNIRIWVYACVSAAFTVRTHVCSSVCASPSLTPPPPHTPPHTQINKPNSLGVVLYVLLTHRPLYADPGDAAFACLLEDRCGELLAHYAALGITGACV